MKDFGQLVTIKDFREEKAERTVIAQRRVFEAAVVERDEADRVLREFQEHAIEEENRLYRDLCSRVVRMRDIDDAKTAVGLLRSEETGHRETLDGAERRRQQEEQQLADDRAAHSAARIMRDKYHELADVFAQEAREASERGEEAQVEEAAETRRPGPQAWEDRP